MRIVINIKKSVEENASAYFERAKKLKKKIEGIKRIIDVYNNKLEELKNKKAIELEKIKKAKIKVKKEKRWYDKFHWFYSSDGFLVIGGKDATTNEIIIKKHCEKNDLVFHTEIPGSPFVVIKSEGKEIPETTKTEAAIECAVYSKSWKIGIIPEVYYVLPEQITKKAPSGEYLTKGAFMIYGKKNFIKGIEMKIAIGVKNGQIIGGPVSAIKKNAEKFVIIIPGDIKKSTLAKMIKEKIDGDVDEIMKFLPGDGIIA